MVPPINGELAVLGEYFAVHAHPRGASLSSPWEPLGALIENPDVLAGRVEEVRVALARPGGPRPDQIDIRVAASVTHLGLIARLIAPVIGTVALGGPALSMAVRDLWWQNTLGGPYPLSVTLQPLAGSGAPLPAVESLTTAVAEQFSLSRHVLWGNIGSATNSAARMISATRPDLTTSAHTAADAVLADPRINGGRLRAGPHFRRHSCCLIYRAANNRAACCGDCILH